MAPIASTAVTGKVKVFDIAVHLESSAPSRELLSPYADRHQMDDQRPKRRRSDDDSLLDETFNSSMELSPPKLKKSALIDVLPGTKSTSTQTEFATPHRYGVSLPVGVNVLSRFDNAQTWEKKLRLLHQFPDIVNPDCILVVGEANDGIGVMEFPFHSFVGTMTGSTMQFVLNFLKDVPREVGSTEKHRILLPKLPPLGVRAVIRFLYCNELPECYGDLPEFLHCADFLGIPKAVGACKSRIQRDFSEEKAMAACEKLIRDGRLEVGNFIHGMLLHRAVSVLRSESLESMTKEQLLLILGDYRYRGNQKVVCEALQRWAMAQLSGRDRNSKHAIRKVLGDTVNLIRWDLLNSEQLMQAPAKLLFDNELRYCQVLAKAKDGELKANSAEYQKAHQGLRDLGYTFPPRQPIEIEVIDEVGIQLQNKFSSNVTSIGGIQLTVRKDLVPSASDLFLRLFLDAFPLFLTDGFEVHAGDGEFTAMLAETAVGNLDNPALDPMEAKSVEEYGTVDLIYSGPGTIAIRYTRYGDPDNCERERIDLVIVNEADHDMDGAVPVGVVSGLWEPFRQFLEVYAGKSRWESSALSETQLKVIPRFG